MKEVYRSKRDVLLTEFTNYLITHPKFNLPLGAEVILVDSRDKAYTSYMLKQAPKKKDNLVFVDVGELTPARSRLKKPKIISRESARKISPPKKRAAKARRK